MADNLIKLPFCRAEEAESIMREIARTASHRFIPTVHAEMRMIEREVSSRQVKRTVESGELIEAPVWDTEHGEKGWKAKFQVFTAGVQVTVVAKLVQRNDVTCLIITVW
jgi:hypothetical protein